MLTPSYRCSFVYLGHGHLVFPQSIRFIPSPFSGPCGAESRQRGWRLLATSRAFRFFGFGAWSLWLINTDLSARALWFPQSTFSPVLTLAGFPPSVSPRSTASPPYIHTTSNKEVQSYCCLTTIGIGVSNHCSHPRFREEDGEGMPGHIGRSGAPLPPCIPLSVQLGFFSFCFTNLLGLRVTARLVSIGHANQPSPPTPTSTCAPPFAPHHSPLHPDRRSAAS